MLLVLAQVELQYPPAKERPTGAGGTTTLQPLSFRPGEAPKAATLPQWAPDQVRHHAPTLSHAHWTNVHQVYRGIRQVYIGMNVKLFVPACWIFHTFASLHQEWNFLLWYQQR